MIRIAVIAAFVPALAEARPQPAPQPPGAAEAPQPAPAPKAPRSPRTFHFDFTFPEIPAIPDLPEFPDVEDFEDLPGMPRLLARGPVASEDDEDDDEDETSKGDGGVRVYRMNRERIVMPRIRMHDRDEDELDERDATAQARGRGSATLQVKGPVTFQVRAQAGDIEAVSTDKPQVSVSVSDAPAEDIALYAFGDRIEPSFRGRRLLRRGKLHVELPKGSRLDVSSMSGDVSAQRVGDVRIRTLSGDVKLGAVAKSDVQSISGDVRIDGASGQVRLHTVSGHAVVQTSGAAPQVEFQSASGSLDWNGLCAKDCHVSAETVSGELRLSVDPKSSFELSYTSHSGELRDEANLSVKRAPRRKHGMASGWLEATFGKGEGVIEADAFSGNLLVRKK